ncbi:hypothetical protein EI42_00746 [Thermosporothrix hazakensis]|jgi:hypothetical protein|uniref:Uncharacterized protein n=2 Tax=Thermosporothrix TaxID=768650 RepID=A0A326UID8_THEHA|nr:hypothetical protein [Thermosporothrix hazakensis]PZW36570.1 hypothetical protein EI42_00746 [Thermosporothrix hazakensis]BBH89038.1 hypothetical protein KTC_37890 [Thermosporothrix sp. COM3]GCE47222.1 hypothetical protein KTH_20910 [Thermosporothrix hazakensis]
MTSTSELRAIIEELELVDIGDAVSYFGEELYGEDDFPALEQLTGPTGELSEKAGASQSPLLADTLYECPCHLNMQHYNCMSW